MKAGTATKLALNTLTTAAMIRIGKVYGNLMVDLRATNAKLRDRSERIVMEMTGLARPPPPSSSPAPMAASSPPSSCTAANVSAARAAEILDACGQSLRKAIEARA